MKQKLILWTILSIVITINSCKKDDENQQDQSEMKFFTLSIENTYFDQEEELIFCILDKNENILLNTIYSSSGIFEIDKPEGFSDDYFTIAFKNGAEKNNYIYIFKDVPVGQSWDFFKATEKTKQDIVISTTNMPLETYRDYSSSIWNAGSNANVTSEEINGEATTNDNIFVKCEFPDASDKFLWKTGVTESSVTLDFNNLQLFETILITKPEEVSFDSYNLTGIVNAFNYNERLEYEVDRESGVLYSDEELIISNPSNIFQKYVLEIAYYPNSSLDYFFNYIERENLTNDLELEVYNPELKLLEELNSEFNFEINGEATTIYSSWSGDARIKMYSDPASTNVKVPVLPESFNGEVPFNKLNLNLSYVQAFKCDEIDIYGDYLQNLFDLEGKFEKDFVNTYYQEVIAWDKKGGNKKREIRPSHLANKE